MPLPDLTAREHEVAAQECDTIAAYLEELAGIVDGPVATHLATGHRMAAQSVRARAEKHRAQAAAAAAAPKSYTWGDIGDPAPRKG
ncbi:hypothetical protein ACWFPY_17715 [Nocardia fluminea]